MLLHPWGFYPPPLGMMSYSQFQLHFQSRFHRQVQQHSRLPQLRHPYLYYCPHWEIPLQLQQGCFGLMGHSFEEQQYVLVILMHLAYLRKIHHSLWPYFLHLGMNYPPRHVSRSPLAHSAQQHSAPDFQQLSELWIPLGFQFLQIVFLTPACRYWFRLKQWPLQMSCFDFLTKVGSPYRPDVSWLSCLEEPREVEVHQLLSCSCYPSQTLGHQELNVAVHGCWKWYSEHSWVVNFLCEYQRFHHRIWVEEQNFVAWTKSYLG